MLFYILGMSSFYSYYYCLESFVDCHFIVPSLQYIKHLLVDTPEPRLASNKIGVANIISHIGRHHKLPFSVWPGRL